MEEIELKFPTFENEESMTESEICVACHGCCSYVTVELEYPRSRAQKDSYRWYLLHKNVEIYIDNDKNWQLLFKTPCNHLREDGVCLIYETRPDICREYQADSCSRVGKDHIHLFSTPEEMAAYLDRNKGKGSAARAKGSTSAKKGSSAVKKGSATAKKGSRPAAKKKKTAKGSK